jgi:hypothetical protein
MPQVVAEGSMFIGICYLCTRPRFLYGSRDVETGWLGWCSICNSKWHAAECKIRLDRTQLVVRYCKQHAHIVTELLIDFLAPNTRCEHERAQSIFWCKLLLGSNMAYYLEHSWRSVIQEPDTDDELEDYHDLNPFWKLQLARNTTRDACPGRPFKLVCAFVSSVDIFRETMAKMIGA